MIHVYKGKMGFFRKILVYFAIFVITVGVLGWLGIQIRPKSFPPLLKEEQPIKTVQLPVGLPSPVERFYRTIYGNQIPIVNTVAILGRGALKPFMNIPIPARFVFVHNAGKDYRHYFEATFFGIPILKVNEGYIDGASFFESRMESNYDSPNANQGANLALWAEAIWFPSLWVIDPRVYWKPVDDHSALLYIPYEEGEETFLVRFNPQTNLIDMMEAMRYRDLGENKKKILWIVRSDEKQLEPGSDVVSIGSVMWLDQAKPWAIFHIEDISFNVDVNELIYQSVNYERRVVD